MCGRKPHSFPIVNLIITDILFSDCKLFSSSKGAFVSLFFIHLVGQPVGRLCMSPFYSLFCFECCQFSREVDCSNNYLTLKRTYCCDLVSPWLSSQLCRLLSLSMVPLLCPFPYPFLEPVKTSKETCFFPLHLLYLVVLSSRLKQSW